MGNATVSDTVYRLSRRFYMKNNESNILRLTALALFVALALSSCDFAAKSLAKQTQNAAKQMAELQDKAADLEEKAANLSPKDRRAFQAELERLGVEGAPEWLYGDEAALMTGAPEETEDEGRGGILGLIGGLFGGGGSSSGGSSSTGGSSSGGSSGGGGTFTLTGIPSQYNGKYAYFAGMGRDGRDAIGIIGVQSDNLRFDDKSVPLAQIRSGRVTLPLWRYYTNAVVRYTGNDTLITAAVVITNQATIGMGDDPVTEISVTFENIPLRNSSATKAWRDGKVQ
jgi:hypothetical protein